MPSGCLQRTVIGQTRGTLISALWLTQDYNVDDVRLQTTSRTKTTEDSELQ